MKALLKYIKAGFVLCLLLVSCTEGVQRQQLTGEALGTFYNIIYYGNNEAIQPKVDSVFQVVNRSLSTYIPDSDISKVNAGDSTLIVDHMFREVFNLSKEVFEDTGGSFDPTVGVLVDAWGFGPGPALEMDSIRVDSLLMLVGFDKVSLRPDGMIVKNVPGIRFDFNAIAKGYAIDRLGLMLSEAGISNYLVEVGGEILTRGENLDRQGPWVVGIDDPQPEDGRNIKATIGLSNQAMASSGNYRKFRIDPETGIKYVHTIDPKTGYTKNSNVLAATVVAEDCATADAYATAFMAMDLDRSKSILEGHRGLEVYIIYLNEQGETREFMTPGFRDQRAAAVPIP